MLDVDERTDPGNRASSPTHGLLHRGLGVLFVISVIVLSGAIPVTLLVSVPDVGRSQGWVLTLLVIVWGGVRLSYAWVNGTPRLFDFFFWVFTYIFMGLAPTAQMRSDQLSTTTPGVGPDLDLRTAAVVLLGIGCYELGRLLGLLYERRHGVTDRAAVVAAVGPVRAWALVAIGLLGSAYFLVQVGGAVTLGSRDAAFAARVTAWPDPAIRAVFYALAIYPLLVGCGALAQVRRQVRSSMQRLAAGGGLLLCCVVLLVIVNPIGSARYTFGTVAFAIAVYFGAVATRFRARITMLVVLLGFLFVFPVADAFRRDEVRVGRDGFYGEYPANPDYDAFWQIANSILFVNDGYLVPLRQALGSLLFWVPRAIWPDKPIDTGTMLAEYRGYTFDNLSAPLWAELIVNGGLLALIIGFVAVGVLMRWMDTRILPSFVHGGLWAVAGGIFPVYMTILLRGSLLQATGTLLVALVCVVALRTSWTRTERQLEAPGVDRRPPDYPPPPDNDRAAPQRPGATSAVPSRVGGLEELSGAAQPRREW